MVMKAQIYLRVCNGQLLQIGKVEGRAVGLEVVRQRRIRTVRKRFVRSIDWR